MPASIMEPSSHDQATPSLNHSRSGASASEQVLGLDYRRAQAVRAEAEHCPHEVPVALMRAAGPAQALGLLGEEPDARAVARFLRHCPGLSKVTIGELLGENEDFYLEVLDAFTDTFDFAGARAGQPGEGRAEAVAAHWLRRTSGKAPVAGCAGSFASCRGPDCRPGR
jgi:hypothetical protein